jgi:DNA-binding Lrp family transcriptional regulator
MNIFSIREQRMYNIRVVLKPQDVVVVLKLCEFDGKRPPFAQIAEELFMSASEVHGAVKRAQASHLLHGIELGERPNCKALEEFLIHGLKYVFPAQHGAMTRGMPTSYAAEPLRRFIKAGDDPPPVWPSPDGPVRGAAFEPLYHSVPEAAKRDSFLYELLALIDAIRDGRVRERELAKKELVTRLRSKDHASRDNGKS